MEARPFSPARPGPVDGVDASQKRVSLMASVPTVEVARRSDGARMVINESDFDNAVYARRPASLAPGEESPAVTESAAAAPAKAPRRKRKE